MSLRLLYRHDMMELYLNDFLMPVYHMPPTTGRVGLMPRAIASVTELRRWQMSFGAAA